MTDSAPVSALFRHIESLHGDAAWGRFLDAGTGVNSAVWGMGLATEQWVGVTSAAAHARQVEATVTLRPQDRLIIGNWTDTDLLHGEVFDTVLADYLVGAIEGFSPYFQPHIFKRLAPHVGRRLFVVGLDPYILAAAPTPAARVVRAIGRLRDACLLLADGTPYREFPAEWVSDAVTAAGFTVISAQRFGNRYREAWVNSQLDMAVRRLPRIDPALTDGLKDRIEALREEGLRLCREEGGLRHGADYVIACEPGKRNGEP